MRSSKSEKSRQEGMLDVFLKIAVEIQEGADRFFLSYLFRTNEDKIF
jgi:hypothetical protein